MGLGMSPVVTSTTPSVSAAPHTLRTVGHDLVGDDRIPGRVDDDTELPTMPRVRLDIGDSDRRDTDERGEADIRIDTEVFRLLGTDRTPAQRAVDPTISRWFDCWRS